MVHLSWIRYTQVYHYFNHNFISVYFEFEFGDPSQPILKQYRYCFIRHITKLQFYNHNIMVCYWLQKCVMLKTKKNYQFYLLPTFVFTKVFSNRLIKAYKKIQYKASVGLMWKLCIHCPLLAISIGTKFLSGQLPNKLTLLNRNQNPNGSN